jgi:Arc/MetJ family transcription regulator
MAITKATWPLTTTFYLRSKIDTTPDYQRPSVWNILSKYHSAMEAVEAMLPQLVKEKRNEDLIIAMKEDLGIKEK